MGKRLVKIIFFGNYFVGLLSIVLSIETAIQLNIPFDSPLYYLLLFCSTVMYYTYAYTGVLQSVSLTNLRSIWYRDNRRLINYSQWFFFLACGVLAIVLLFANFQNIFSLPLIYSGIVLMLLLASVLYYGLLPKSVIRLNLRNTGWLKAFVIGFVWAGAVGLLPLVMLKVEAIPFHADPVLTIGLFIKNWMFCTVNAIIFDLKDYADDSNKQLQTFAVKYGLHKTISYILIPLTLIGMLFLLPFAYYRHFTFLPFFINLIPFLLLIWVSYSMHRQKSIFYYLIVIDGIVMIKGICGIVAMQFVSH
jgi:4-hydroxybenzoate polyprenyltransferase